MYNNQLTNNVILYIVIPCFNEEECLHITSKEIKSKINELILNKKISQKSKVIFVNDGSIDNTWNIIKQLHENDSLFSGVNLSRNRGHQNALLAGLMVAKDMCDITISMDADLQDDINAIDKMLEEYYNGSDIVYGVRCSRKTDTKFKRITAEFFYKLMKFLGCEIVYNHADYRLMSKRAINSLSKFQERNLFLRGIIPYIGYHSSIVYYIRKERVAGKSKYPLRKMLSFAWQGITSLSIKPIRCISLLGLAIFLSSIVMLLYIVFRWYTGSSVLGWASIVFSIWSIGGLVLLSLGIIGEYIGKIYLETKNRPRYIIEDIINKKDNIT